MTADDRSDTDLMLRAVDRVHDAHTLDEALAALVSVLQHRFDLWHANFAIVPVGSSSVRVLASWSMTDSAFTPGTEVATSITPTLAELFQDLHEGEVAIIMMEEGSESLVDHLLREQGVSSVAAVPIHTDQDGMLMLTLGSSGVGPLHEMGARFFHGLAAGIRERVDKLVLAS